MITPTDAAAMREAAAIKPLEWDRWHTEGGPFGYMLSPSNPDGSPALFENGQWQVQRSLREADKRLGIFDTPGEAKAAAQADYEDRILSALTLPAPVGDVRAAAKVLLDALTGPVTRESSATAMVAFNGMTNQDTSWHDFFKALSALAQKE